MRALSLALLLASSPALADVVTDTEDTTSEEDTKDDSGCSSAPLSAQGFGVVALGGLLLLGLRRET